MSTVLEVRDLKKSFGGIVAVEDDAVKAELPLPVAGLLADAPLEEVISRSLACNDAARALGWSGATPFLTLSFLGLGVPPPTPTWGRMLAEGRDYLTVASWIAVFPGLAILFTVLGINFLGDGLRDLLDPRLRRQT